MIEIYTDGSAKNNGYENATGAYGIVVITDNEVYYGERFSCDEHTTNNREEIKAVITAFQYIENQQFEEPCIIYSDSAYVVNMVNDWIYKWANNNWINSKNKTVENKDLVEILYYYITKVSYPCQVQVKKVGGHNNNYGNEMADALATGNINKYIKYKVLLEKN